MKSGIKSTEFWATVAINVLNVLAMFQGRLDGQAAAIVGAVTTIGYTVARSFVKAKESK